MRADPQAYHCWWELPEPWRAETFVAAAPCAVRLALASPPVEVLSGALDTLAAVARSSPEDSGIE